GDGVEDVAAHVAEGAGAATEPLPPFAGMIVALDERPLGSYPQPQVPVKTGRHRVGPLRTRLRVAPRLAAPRMHFLHLADRAVVDELDHQLVLAGGVNLN